MKLEEVPAEPDVKEKRTNVLSFPYTLHDADSRLPAIYLMNPLTGDVQKRLMGRHDKHLGGVED